MALEDSVYSVAITNPVLGEQLAQTEWETSAIYQEFRPPESDTDIKVPYITYQFDIMPVSPWPTDQYTFEFDIWDMNEGQDNSRALKIAQCLMSIFDRREIVDEYGLPSTMRNTTNIWLQDMPGVIHRKVVFVCKSVNMQLLNEGIS